MAAASAALDIPSLPHDDTIIATQSRVELPSDAHPKLMPLPKSLRAVFIWIYSCVLQAGFVQMAGVDMEHRCRTFEFIIYGVCISTNAQAKRATVEPRC